MPIQLPLDRSECQRAIAEMPAERREEFLRQVAKVDLNFAFELSLSCKPTTTTDEQEADATQADGKRHFIDGQELVFCGSAIIGGMGHVRRARLGDELVAVKSLPPSMQHIPERVERFHREYNTLRRLFHRNIVSCRSVDPNGEFFLMQFIEGFNAQDWRHEHDCTPQLAAEIVLQIAEAVSYAHDHDVIHRDIKPRNVVIDESDGVIRPVLIDFGIASCNQFDAGLTGGPIGTRWYMSPEQYSSVGATQPTVADDVYGLGGLLYFLISGYSPYAGACDESRPEDLKTIVTDPSRVPLSFRYRGTFCPPELETICLKCLRTIPAERYGSAAVVAEDLGRFLRGDTINAAPETLPKKSARILHRHRVPLAIAAAFALFACSLLVLWNRSARAERQYHRATASLVNVLDFLSGTLRREELLRSPDLAAFRYTLLAAYEQNHQLALHGNASHAELQQHLSSVLSIARLAEESGMLDIARRLVNSATSMNERLGGETSQYHLAIKALKVSLARDEEDYRLAIRIGRAVLQDRSDAAAIDERSDTPETQRLLAQISLEVAWSHFFCGELSQALTIAEQSRVMHSAVFQRTSSHEDRIRSAEAINCVAYMIHKGAQLPEPELRIAGLVEPATPTIVALGHVLLDGASHECRNLLVARAELNNTLGLSLVSHGQIEQAARTHEENIVIYEQLCRSWPLVVQYQAGLAKSLGNLADVLDRLQRHSRSLDFRFAAVETYRNIIEAVGPQRDYQNDYATHAVRLHAALLNDPEREYQALEIARQAVEVAPRIEQAESRCAIQQVNAAILLAHLADQKQDSAHSASLLRRCRECLERARHIPGTAENMEFPAGPIANFLTEALSMR